VSTRAPSSDGGDDETDVAILCDCARSLLHFGLRSAGGSRREDFTERTFLHHDASARRQDFGKAEVITATVSEIVLVAEESEVNWLVSKPFLPKRTDGDPFVKFDASYVDPVTAPEHALNWKLDVTPNSCATNGGYANAERSQPSVLNAGIPAVLSH